MRSWMCSIGGSLTCMALLAGCAKESSSGAATGKGSGQGQPVPVLVAPVVQQDVPVELRTFGYVEANLTVTVRAQITGVLMAIYFKEGQNVRKGDPLFSIDPRPFEVAIQQAEANVARDKATHENAIKEAQRQKELLAKGITSQGEYDAAQTASDSLLATIRSGEAAIERAKIDLGYCSIRSPIDGRVGAWLIDAGNLVSANGSTLVTINQVRPIQVSFYLVQDDLHEVQKELARHDLEVLALIRGHEDRPEKGRLTFIDNTVDRTTGKFLLKATFPNAEERLWPGLLVDVVLVLRMQKDAIVIPSRVIQTGQKGIYVFVVKPDQTVEDRLVTVERTTDGDSVISKGLAAGETVVKDGQLRLVPGAKVVVRTGLDAGPPAAKAPKSPGPNVAAEAEPASVGKEAAKP